MKKLIKIGLRKLGYKLSRYNPLDNIEPELITGPKTTIPLRVVVGGGDTFYGSDWHNIEFVTGGYSDRYKTLPKNIDIDLDLSKCPHFPINENTLDAVYTSHVIEHLQDNHVQNIFDNAFRVLKTGGHLRISCPDIDLYIRALHDNDLAFFHYRHVSYYRELGINESINGLFLDVFTRQCDKNIARDEILNLISTKGTNEALNVLKSKEFYDPAFSNHHINWFNFEKVSQMLELSGFNKIRRSQKGQSFNPKMRNMSVFDTGDEKISMYIEAQK